MKIYMLRTLFPVLTIFFCLNLHAQDIRKREVGIQLSGLNFDGSNSFGGFYKKQLSENKYRRIHFFAGRMATALGNENVNASVFLAGGIGREKRKPLDSRLEFYRGPEFSMSIGYQQANDQNLVTFSGGIGFVLGLQHSFSELWAIQIETIPGIRVAASFPDEGEATATLSANISNSVALGVVRKF